MEEDHGEHPGDLRVHRGAGIVSSLRERETEPEKHNISDFVQVGLQTGTPVLLEAEDRLLL